MMTKWILRRKLGVILAGLLITWSFPGQLPAAEQVRSNSRTIIKSAAEVDYPPFCVVSPDGKADGFSVELLREALSAVNLDVTFKVGQWNKIKDELRDGNIQVLPLVGRTPEREAIYDFTFPYLTLHGAIFVRKGDTRIKRVSDLADKTVVVMRGDNAEEFARRTNISSHIVPVGTYKQAMELLDAGKYDAVIAQRLMGIQLLNDIGIRKVVPLDIVLDDFRQDFCFAVRSGDKVLLSRLNEGLSIVIANGIFDRLHSKWFGPLLEQHITLEDALKRALPIIIPVFFAVALMSIVLLRSEVKRKTKSLILEIDKRKKTEAEREKLIDELRDALANIKQLSEMLPICAYCKKIRDDKGYWEGVETYITRHTDTVFSHGMCPECAEKVMKDIETFKEESGS